MIIQISSGHGPAECEIAAKNLMESLEMEFPDGDFRIIKSNGSKKCEGFSSVVFETHLDLSFLEGSVEWRCKSFLRPGHKRKNWFVDVSIIPDIKPTEGDGEIEWQFFRCGGKGGQNVNKVETGVRLLHKDSGLAVKCTQERSQNQNRKIALKKMEALLSNHKKAEAGLQSESEWKESQKIVRGNPVRIYEGESFRRIR